MANLYPPVIEVGIGPSAKRAGGLKGIVAMFIMPVPRQGILSLARSNLFLLEVRFVSRTERIQVTHLDESGKV